MTPPPVLGQGWCSGLPAVVPSGVVVIALTCTTIPFNSTLFKVPIHDKQLPAYRNKTSTLSKRVLVGVGWCWG